MSDTSAAPVNGTNGGVVLPFDFPTTFTPAGTDFKPVALGVGANLEPLPTYFTDPLLQTGNLPGVAISAFNNRALRQGTFVASSLCLWISDQTQVYVPDDGNQINWMGLYNQALADFILSVLPPGPNLGAYLPLAGGTMVGNIQFQTGVSTILANNTWYFGRDTGGQARGLIVKGSDNNIYINDGSSTYVFFHGSPSVDNGVSWGGKDTSGTEHAIIGLLSDNNTHIANTAGPGHIYMDCSSGGSVWTNSNIVIPNNNWYYARDTGGTPRNIIGINNGNSLLVGAGATGTTDIYGPGNIYLHNTTVAYGQFNVNGYLYSQGGARCYIPGGNDPLQIYADNGYYSRLHYVIGGLRDWSEGALSNGTWALADESAHALRLQVDFNGTLICFNSLQVNGGATVNGTVSLGGLTILGAGQVNGGLTVYNGINVASGGLGVAANGQINGGLTVYNGLNVASGNGNIAGSLVAGGNITCNNTLFVSNQAQVWNHLYVMTGDLHVQNGGAYFAGTITTPVLNGGQGNNNIVITGGAVVYPAGGQQDALWINGNIQFNGWEFQGPQGGTNFYGGMIVQAMSGQLDSLWAYGNIRIFNGRGYQPGGGFWLDSSDARLKKDIEPYTQGLDAICKLRPVSYCYNGLGKTKDDGVRYHGLVAQDVLKVMPEMVFEEEVRLDSKDDGGTPFYMMNATALTYALINAVQELAAQLDALKRK
jgi:hypothetical protein